MTIADNLTALANQKLGYQDSVEACKTSLINKDVVVPVGAKLADISGLIDQITADKSWENYVAVRNRTKTTIEEGDIDVSNFSTALWSASNLFLNCNLTKAHLDFKNINQSFCFNATFQGNSNLMSLTIGLPKLNSNSAFSYIFFNSNSINNLTLIGLSDSLIWSNTTAQNNLFAQTQLATCQNLTITVPILPNLYLAVMTSLNLASVVQVLGQLYNYSAGAAHTITFNRSFTALSLADYNIINNAKIQANARNWTVAGLTYSM